MFWNSLGGAGKNRTFLYVTHFYLTVLPQFLNWLFGSSFFLSGLKFYYFRMLLFTYEIKFWDKGEKFMLTLSF